MIVFIFLLFYTIRHKFTQCFGIHLLGSKIQMWSLKFTVGF